MIWIRSQKRTSLVEVSHVKICEALSNGKVSGYTIDYDTPDATFELGKYSTKEKALQVLDLIQEEISHIQCLYPASGYNPILVKKAFQMPQDNEVQDD